MKQETMGSRWQWHQLDNKQIICTSLQTDNHTSTSSLKLFTGQTPDVLPDAQPRVSKHKRHNWLTQVHLKMAVNQWTRV